MPSARSSESEPVETAPTETAARSFIFMTEPLPNCRSIWPSATSSASFSIHLSHLLERNRFENLVLRPARSQP